MNVGCTRSAPGRDPCSLLKGALRLQILNIYRASSGLRGICDHERRRNEIRKGPAWSRNSTASRRVRKSYGARWICESPLNMIDRITSYKWLSTRVNSQGRFFPHKITAYTKIPFVIFIKTHGSIREKLMHENDDRLIIISINFTRWFHFFTFRNTLRNNTRVYLKHFQQTTIM